MLFFGCNQTGEPKNGTTSNSENSSEIFSFLTNLEEKMGSSNTNSTLYTETINSQLNEEIFNIEQITPKSGEISMIPRQISITFTHSLKSIDPSGVTLDSTCKIAPRIDNVTVNTETNMLLVELSLGSCEESEMVILTVHASSLLDITGKRGDAVWNITYTQSSKEINVSDTSTISSTPTEEMPSPEADSPDFDATSQKIAISSKIPILSDGNKIEDQPLPSTSSIVSSTATAIMQYQFEDTPIAATESISNQLVNGTSLSSADSTPIFSPDKKSNLVMQTDGNLVLYQKNTPIWSTNTQNKGTAPYKLTMQKDNNLVIYDTTSKVIWDAGTNTGVSGSAHLEICNDGNLEIKTDTNSVLWTTRITNILNNNQSIFSGKKTDSTVVISPDGTSKLDMQWDGNLVVYQNNIPIWASGQDVLSRAPYRLYLQKDNNLVIYNSSNLVLWASGTNKGPPRSAYLEINNSGIIEIKTSATEILWSSKPQK